MAVVFLIARVVFGGYFAYRAATYLSPYGRPAVAARHGIGQPGAVIFGLMSLLGGVAIVMGTAIEAAIALIVTLLLVSSARMRPFWRIHDPVSRKDAAVRFAINTGLAVVALLFLSVPGPWPFVVVA